MRENAVRPIAGWPKATEVDIPTPNVVKYYDMESDIGCEVAAKPIVRSHSSSILMGTILTQGDARVCRSLPDLSSSSISNPPALPSDSSDAKDPPQGVTG